MGPYEDVEKLLKSRENNGSEFGPKAVAIFNQYWPQISSVLRKEILGLFGDDGWVIMS